MNRFKFALVVLVLFVMLIGCQPNDIKEEVGKNVYKIEVLQWETEELVAEITDEHFIEKLIEALNSAETVSTAFVDFRSPDYQLKMTKNDEILYELGYYKESMKLAGIEGRYLNLNMEEEIMYGVILELPINN